MKFVYGKQDWRTKERGQENCYLLTNGLGGFSSCTMIGSCTRNDHALLMAAVKAPNYRCNMIHHLEETLTVGEKVSFLSSQDYVEQNKEETGYQYLETFIFEDCPKWVYRVEGVEITKEIAMKQGTNTVAVVYEIENRSQKEAVLSVIPHMQFVPKGKRLEAAQSFYMKNQEIVSNGYRVYFQTNGKVEQFPDQFIEGFYYAYDDCDGRCATGNTNVNHRIMRAVPSGEKEVLFVIYSMEEIKEDAKKIIGDAKKYRRSLEKKAGFHHPLARMLVKSADQFIAERESTKGKTILAGYPFFEDWGRDTMIALTGCCICTGRKEDAKQILRTFSAHCRKGLMPNLFPEGENEPMYNTVDASLLFIHAVYQYDRAFHERDFVEELWPVMKEIVEAYRQGTDFHIRMEEDGLISAGANLEQVTWMDVRVGEILPTPRHGKPVEINAYWYNALCMMAGFAKELGKDSKEYEELALRVKKNFRKAFWNEEKSCLRDVLSQTAADEQIRCNQIWAVSMPFSLLEEEQERRLIDTVFEKLYTPYGLRTLSMDEKEFVGSYGGDQLKRDLAYHQGTVWAFPLGAYYLAYLKVNHGTKAVREKVKEQLEALESALREGCIGQLPEIYDGAIPNVSRGCFAQAWSVGELLRVFAELEWMEQEENK